MNVNDSEIDRATKEPRERLRRLEQRMRDKDPTLLPNSGYVAHIGRKHIDHLVSLNEKREIKAHRNIAHADRDGIQVILCSRGGEIPGYVREMGEQGFPKVEGHIPSEGIYEARPSEGSPT